MCCMDNYDLWERHDAEQQAQLNRLPKCSECGEPIQDEQCFEFEGKYICKRCMKDNHEVDTEDLMQ